MPREKLHSSYGYVTTSVLLMALVLQGCILGGGKRAVGTLQEEVITFDGKISVDAYLFDVKFKENGKRRSVRLDVYFADSLALFTARAYLGKGVAKGIWQKDSSLFYFPTEHEYYSGPLDELARAGCANGGDLQRIIPALLSGEIASMMSDYAVQLIKGEFAKSKEVEVNVKLGSCETPVTLVFDYQDQSASTDRLFYLKEFSYDPQDGKSKVVGKRRALKRGKGLAASKFRLNIPSDAMPVQW